MLKNGFQNNLKKVNENGKKLKNHADEQILKGKTWEIMVKQAKWLKSQKKKTVIYRVIINFLINFLMNRFTLPNYVLLNIEIYEISKIYDISLFQPIDLID